jgi:tetratricopeptide (TPR) repeat protein
VETIKFVFWEAIKILGLAFLGLVAAKTVASFKPRSLREASLRVLKLAFYLVIAGLAILGARIIGNDIAAQLYLSASQDDLAHGRYSRAYDNALRAVELRPGALRCWRMLALTKIAQRQYASALDDEPAFRSLSGGELDEEDAYRFAVCHFYLSEYDKSLLLTQKLISENRFYAAPYVLQGTTYIVEKKYRDAELTFLIILQTFPTDQDAVEGLAHAYFLEGNRGAATRILEETNKHPFTAAARQRFDALKAMYAQ